MREQSVDVLRAVAGAASRIKDVTPVWTAPAGAVGGGALTADMFALVGSANTSVVCATYNLQPSSALWAALVDLRTRRPGVSVRLYLDTQAADGPFHRPEGRRGYREQNHDRGGSSRLNTGEITQRLRGAVVMRARAPEDDGRAVTSHAKFLSIDHRFLLVGSANFSFSAEERNVELGLRLDDPALAHSVEKQMHDLEETVYEPVP